jgi:type VI secretion system protein ImpA
MHPSLESLLEPISPDRPQGDDLSCSVELDEIRRARKEEDTLSQGEWVEDARPPQWSRVRTLCESLLATRTKDLQVGCHYAESLVRLEGFPGLSQGMRFLQRLTESYWDCLHPCGEDGCPEERVARLEWLDLNLAHSVRLIPLTGGEKGGYCSMEWESAKALDNLAQRDPAARAREAGQPSADLILKAARQSGSACFHRLQAHMDAAQESLAAFQECLRPRLAEDTPAFTHLHSALEECRRAARAFQGPQLPASQPPEPPLHGSPPSAQAPASRGQAIQALNALAHYFREQEPLSPVSYLVERAARWAQMPLGEWLDEVVKDPSTLGQLRDLLQVHQGT